MSGVSRVIEIMRAARWHSDHNIRKGDKVVVVTDPAVVPEIPVAFAAAASSVGAEVVTVYMRPPSAPGEEPPRLIVDILRHADVAITCSSETLSFTEAKNACLQAGGKHLSVPGANVTTFTRGIVEVYFEEEEYQKMRSRALWLTDRLIQANEILLTSENGTNIKGSIAGRMPSPSYGCAEGKYRSTSFPSGEVMIPPLEGSTEGVVFFDASMGGVGKISTPIKLIAKHGRAIEITGGDEADRLRRLVERSGEGADNIAEFGIGLNHKGMVTGNKNEDKKIAGSAHIALGDNHTFGGGLYEGMAGCVRANIHLDGVIKKASVYLDGEKVIDNGTLLF